MADKDIASNEEWADAIADLAKIIAKNDSRPSVDPAYMFYNHDTHNHVTRDIKPEGECPACDEYLKKEKNGEVTSNESDQSTG